MILATGGSTDDPVLTAICRAHSVNSLSGGAVIAPWEVDALPDEWLDAFSAMGGAVSWEPEEV